MEPAISVTIAVAVLLAFVLYSGFTLSTLGTPVAGTGLRRNVLVGGGMAGAGLPIGGPTGAAGQLASMCVASRTFTATTACTSSSAPAAQDSTPTVTMTAEQPTPRHPSRPPAGPVRTCPAGGAAGPMGDRVTDPVGEPPPLLWLRDQARSKDLTQSGKNCGTPRPD